MKRYINREISWLSFNERVLQEAEDSTVPIINRFRFLGIFSNNLDEFYRVRYSSVRRIINEGDPENDKPFDGIDVHKLLEKINKKVDKLQNKYNKIFSGLVSELGQKNIFIIDEKKVEEEHKDFLKEFFQTKIYPVLQIILLNERYDFPQLKDSDLFLFTRVEIPISNKKDKTEFKYAIIVIPKQIDRFIVLPNLNRKKYIILLEDVIRMFLKDIFSIFHPVSADAYALKITRDAELSIDNDLQRSFIDKISKSLERRKKGDTVRLVYDKRLPKEALEFLRTSLGVDEEYDNIVDGVKFQNKRDLIKFPNVGRKTYEYESVKPLPVPGLSNAESVFDAVLEKDYLVHVPYQDFYEVIRFLKEASLDPTVTKISMTIYRVADDSKILNCLINAAKNGKRVMVNMELRARFDEEANVRWSQVLQKAGIEVNFGIPDLKVHSKLCLVEREGKKDLAIVGTGNFHENTARIYTDFFLLTSDKRVTSEVKDAFSFLKKSYLPYNFKNFLFSPLDSRTNLYALIDYEIYQARKGKEAFVHLYINNLVDQGLIDKLYEASGYGVKIRLLVRGICSLIPGKKGLSENIEAYSIVDKFLEHPRMYWFCNNQHNSIFISSADWMRRNIDLRVEVGAPIFDDEIKKNIMSVFEMYWKDNTKSRILDEKQKNIYKKPLSGEKQFRAQKEVYNYYKGKWMMESLDDQNG